MDHAVAAFLVAASVAVLVPFGGFDQFLEGGDVAFLQKKAGLLPAEDVVGGVAPGRALVIDVALEEFEEVGGEVEFPVPLAVGENLAEEFLGVGFGVVGVRC